ncbi:MAG: GNAT family N-acetyltransferase [Alphaproteobacteria bacterium]|nr:GNAT family N-acetyltransferase [Alphaproteobacteria bacterium]
MSSVPVNLTLKKLEMNTADLRSLLDLQDKIIAGFKPDEQHFILHRTIDDFSNALKSDHMYVFGLYDGDRLVSQSILSLPGDRDTRDLPEFAGEYKNSELAVFKAVLVDPEYRGRGLMKQMLKIREQVAAEHGRKIAITQIAADNPASWVNAIQYGMQITKVGFDPEDNAKVIYLQKRLDGKAPIPSEQNAYRLSLGSDVHKNVPALFNKMMKLSAAGMIGSAWDKQNNQIIWYPSATAARIKKRDRIFVPAARQSIGKI